MALFIISPIKDEENTIELTIQSVTTQDCLPEKWIIINDGSTDKTLDIVNNAAIQYPFIEVVDTPLPASSRATGGRVVDLFNYGLKLIQPSSSDIILKLDGDITFDETDYFSFIVDQFEKTKNLGIASGYVYHLDKDKRVYENRYLWHTQGQTKFYRFSCLTAMGGLKPFKGWDGIDDILARNKGFDTRMFLEKEVKHHYKAQTRIQEGGRFKGIKREALGYRNRSFPVYMYFFKSIKLSFEKPFLLAGLYFLFSSIQLAFTIKPVLSKTERKAVRKFTHQRMLNRIK